MKEWAVVEVNDPSAMMYGLSVFYALLRKHPRDGCSDFSGVFPTRPAAETAARIRNGEEADTPVIVE
jgi:hypothetical protein